MLEPLWCARRALGDLRDTPLGVWALSRHPGQVTRIVAMAFGVPRHCLVGEQRGGRQIQAARQVAYYLLSTGLNMPAVEVADMFGRHRSTVEYGLARVEDQRDVPQFDAMIDGLEKKMSLPALA